MLTGWRDRQGVRVENANLDDLAQRYAGAQAAIEATSNYYHIHETLSEHLDVTVAHPKELNQIADTDDTGDGVAVFAGNMLILVGVCETVFRTFFILDTSAWVRGDRSC